MASLLRRRSTTPEAEAAIPAAWSIDIVDQQGTKSQTRARGNRSAEQESPSHSRRSCPRSAVPTYSRGTIAHSMRGSCKSV